MQRPVQISFQGLLPHPEAERVIEEEASSLERFYDRITSCRVVVDVPHRHHKKGKEVEVRVDIHVPGDVIAVKSTADDDEPGGGVMAATRNAFKAARRQLEDFARKRRGDVKTHESTPDRA